MYNSETLPQTQNFDYFDWCSGIIGNTTSTNSNSCNNTISNNTSSNNLFNNLNQIQNNIDINSTAVGNNINATSPTLSSISTPPLTNNTNCSNSNTQTTNATDNNGLNLSSLPFFYQFVPNYGMVLTPVKGANNSGILPPQAWAQSPQQLQQPTQQVQQVQQQPQQGLVSIPIQQIFNQQTSQQQQQAQQQQIFQNFLKYHQQLTQLQSLPLPQLNGSNMLPYIDMNVKPSVDIGADNSNINGGLFDNDSCIQVKKIKKEPGLNGVDSNTYIMMNNNPQSSPSSSSSLVLSDNSSPEQSAYVYSPSATLSPPTLTYDQQTNQNNLVLVGTPISLLPIINNNNNNNNNNNHNNNNMIYDTLSVNHWETGIEPDTLKKQNEISKLLFVKSNSVFFENYSDVGKHQACWNLNEPMHRNYYQAIYFKLPNASGNDNISLPITKTDENNGVVDSEKLSYFTKFPCSYENYRIYIHPSLGYSGNAKRFKHMPDTNENALVFDGNVYDGNLNPIYSCKICTEYYQTKSYFSANPNAKGKVLLVKNNILTRVKDGSFSLSLKPMCCSGHNSQLPLYFHFTLTNPNTGKVVLQSLINVNVKQWKKSQPKPNSSSKRKRENSIVFDIENHDE